MTTSDLIGMSLLVRFSCKDGKSEWLPVSAASMDRLIGNVESARRTRNTNQQRWTDAKIMIEDLVAGRVYGLPHINQELKRAP